MTPIEIDFRDSRWRLTDIQVRSGGKQQFAVAIMIPCDPDAENAAFYDISENREAVGPGRRGPSPLRPYDRWDQLWDWASDVNMPEGWVAGPRVPLPGAPEIPTTDQRGFWRRFWDWTGEQ